MDNPFGVTVQSDSHNETLKIASIVACFLKPGDVICLDGDLGAGKTAFTEGIASGLGMDGVVSSPTFTIMHEYIRNDPKEIFSADNSAIKRINHFDVYRLSDADEFIDLGFEEVLDSDDAISVIEWAGRLGNILKREDVRVVLRRDDGQSDDVGAMIRRIEISFSGNDERFKDLVDRLSSSGCRVLRI